jgi:hypothetical protein
MTTHAKTTSALLILVAATAACGPADVSDGASIAPPPDSAALATLTADSAVILDGLRYLASDELQGRGTGSEGAALARARLAGRFEAAGLEPLGDSWEHTFTWSRQNQPEEHVGTNLVGVRRGTELPDRYIVVSGHHDHVGVRDGEIYNGADDNASGAVGVAALAAALRGIPLRHSVIFVSFDAEESGLRGARAFVAEPPVPLEAIVLDVNMDMVSRTAGVLWAGGTHQTPALRPILEGVAARAPLDFRLGHDAPDAPEGADWTNQSDQGPFNDAGIPFVYLGVEDHPDYHHPTDDFDRVDPGEYMNALRTALLTVLAMDQAFPLASDPPESPETLP